MKTIIITSEKYLDRKNKIEKQLKDRNISFLNSPSVFLEEIPKKYKEMEELRARKHKSYASNLGQIGCFEAHKNAITKGKPFKENLLVLEDDCVFTEHFDKFYPFLDNFLNENKLDVLMLSNRCCSDNKFKILKLGEYGRPPKTEAVFINKTSIEKILLIMDKYFAPIDQFYYICGSRDVPKISYGQMNPRLVCQERGFSVIGHVNKKDSPR